MIFYDYPLNEQVRVFLRLTALFRRVFHFLQRDDPWDHHAALMSLFEIVDGTNRVDVKSDLLQGMERQRGILSALRNNPQIEQESLLVTLGELDVAIEGLYASKGKFAEHLRNHEGLMAIKQRAAIPGGLCDFDLPSYHYWLSLAVETRREQFRSWIAPLLPTRTALELHIRLMLKSGKTLRLEAPQGLYQQSKVGPEVRLLRVAVDDSCPCVPEISANKYLLNIRFLEAGEAARNRVMSSTVPFGLVFCSF
ncbi:MAG: cell division protein ZapD [Ferrovum sp.]|nr:cell division protein ZapD [Ferrovum sp.]NDU88198.1 cell division protein ZapD [Ferrovum sp.]